MVQNAHLIKCEISEGFKNRILKKKNKKKKPKTQDSSSTSAVAGMLQFARKLICNRKKDPISF